MHRAWSMTRHSTAFSSSTLSTVSTLCTVRSSRVQVDDTSEHDQPSAPDHLAQVLEAHEACGVPSMASATARRRER